METIAGCIVTRRSTGKDLIKRVPEEIAVLLRGLAALADERGLPLYLVGGVVRDLLLRRRIWDLDVTVEGDGIAFARLVADRYRAGIAVFERFATARLVLPDGLKVDIATARRESYARPAVLPEVERARLDDDLYRRDFTINAMAIRLNAAQFGQLYDPYGGLRDLKAGTIRVLHDDSFTDDPTRVFRAIRFAQRFGFVLEPRTRRLLKEAAATDLIHRLSGPRLCNELLLLFGERNPRKPIEWLVRLKLLRFLHPRLRYTRGVRGIVAALPEALQWWRKQCPDQTVDQRLAYLMALLDEGSPSVLRSISHRLQLSTAQSKTVDWAGSRTDRVARALMQRTAMRPSEVYRLLKTIPVEAMVLLVAKGMMTKGPGRSLLTGRLSRFLKQDRRQTTLLKGTDLIRIGLKPGPKFKTILDRLLDARLNGHVRTKSEEQALVHRLARLPA